MRTLKIHSLLAQRIIATRESARSLSPALVSAVTSEGIELDFIGVEGVAPSFVDELLGALLEVLNGKDDFVITFRHPPTRLSTKFQAIGRGRGFCIVESDANAWTIRRAAA